MSTENFTRALQLTHSFNPNSASPYERLEAERYLMELRERPEGLNLSFHIISNEAVDEVRCFWAFNTIMHHLPALAAITTTPTATFGASGPSCSSSSSPAAVDDVQAEELYRTLFSFIYRYLFTPQQQQQQQQQQSMSGAFGGSGASGGLSGSSSSAAAAGSSPSSDFLLNKHAQLMVVGLQCFYPNRWRSFFDDLFDLLARSAALPLPADAVAVYFLRIFEYIDERVVSVRERTLQERGKEMRARDMAVKDAMRDQVVPRLVQTWFGLLSEMRHRAPAIASLCLSVVQTYIEWIDANLIMTADWINLFYFTMTVPPTMLRVAACECILSLVSKKQLPGLKMESLRALSVVASLPRIVSMLTVPPAGEDDLSLIDAVARLVVAVAEQFLQLIDMGVSGNRPPSTVLIAPDTGLNMTDIPFEFSRELLDSLADALHAVMAQLLRIYQLPGFPEIREVVLPLLQTYLKAQVVTEAEAAEIIVCTLSHMRVEGLAEQVDRVWEDNVIDHRKLLFTVVRLLHRRFPALVMQHLLAVVQGVVQSRQPQGDAAAAAADGTASGSASDSLAYVDFTHPEVVEAALHYAYEIGEAVKLDVLLKDTSDAVTVMTMQLLTCDAVAVAQTNPCVHLAFFEFLERYYLFFAYHAEYIPVLLQRLLLLPCGVTNPNDRVRARICYLFSRMVQMLKGSLRPYAADMVHAILSIVNITATGGSGASSGGSGDRKSLLLQPSDQRELYEATGTLLALLLSTNGSSSSRDSDDANNGTLAKGKGSSSGLPLPQNSDALGNGSATQGTSPEGDSNSYCVTLTEMVVDSVLQRLRQASDAADGISNSSNNNGGGVVGARGSGVADAVSYLSALAKGMTLSDILNVGGANMSNTNGSNGNSACTTKTASLAGSFFAGGTGRANPMEAFLQAMQQQQQSLPPGCTTALHLAQFFCSVTERHVMPVLSSGWRSSLAVRDAGGQFFQQMVNTVPYEFIAAAYEAYVPLTLSSMETVPELARLLRLMYQFVNKSSSKGVGTVSSVTPIAWAKVLSLGELSSPASPLVCLGVVSESAREKADVYRQFFTYIFSIAAWGCAPALLLMPEDCCLSILSQLVEAVTLPVDLELPKAALQTLGKLTSELFGSSNNSSNSAGSNGTHTANGGGGGAPTSKADALLAQFPSDAAQLSRALALYQHVLLAQALPTVLRVVMRPPPPPPLPVPPGANASASAVGANSTQLEAEQQQLQLQQQQQQDQTGAGMFFDLTDGKSFLLLGEVGTLCKACVGSPFGEDALQAIFQCLVGSGRIPEAQAMGFCCAVRDQPRFNSVLKLQFKQMLEAAQQQQR